MNERRYLVSSAHHGVVARTLPLLEAMRLARWLSDEAPMMVRNGSERVAVFVSGNWATETAVEAANRFAQERDEARALVREAVGLLRNPDVPEAGREWVTAVMDWLERARKVGG